MARYTDDSLERVRDAVDMVDLVGSRVELRRAGGSSFSGLCPFHDERTPSFSVDASKKLYHCFGCGEGGDAITFVQKLEGLDFVGAIEYLADRYRVALELVEENPAAAARRERRERLMELLERAATFYARTLWESDEAAGARAYLAERGLEEALLREFRVGYAPSAWDTMLLAARRAGFQERDLVDAGLAQHGKGGGRVHDRFRRRIMFPLADGRGRVLGFGARALGADQQPKYLNTSENELFVKGRQLFGQHIARPHAARSTTVLVAEGYTDVIALHQAGLRNAVGIMGTAMTPDQVGALARLAPTVLLALDADSAGQEAMLRAARVASERRLPLRVVPMPAGLDPADLVQQQGAEAMAALVERSVPFDRFQVERALSTADLASAEGKDAVLERLRPVFALIPPSIQRQELVHLVADKLNVRDADVDALLAVRPADLGRLPARATSNATLEVSTPPPPSAPAPRRAITRSERIERTFLALCIALPAVGAEALERLTPEHFSSALLARAAEHLRAHLADPTDGVGAEDEELRALMTELSVRAARGAPTRETLRVEELQLEMARLDRAITAARGGDGGSVADLARAKAQVQAQLDTAMDAAVRATG